MERNAKSLCLIAAALIASVAISGCDRDTRDTEESFKSPEEIAALERSRRCHAQAGEARLKLLQSGEIPPSVEFVITSRRENERICSSEAECLGIRADSAGMYLLDCLSRLELNN